MKTYGILGLLLILLTELNFYFKIEPFAYWYFPLIWTGYILFLDATIYKLKGNSLLSNHPKRLIFLIFLSLATWWIFEFINYFTGNWHYTLDKLYQFSIKNWKDFQQIFSKYLSFATVIPALFETAELILTLHWFDHISFKHKHTITKNLLFILLILGLLSLLLPLMYPAFFFPLVWVCFFFFLDPINYLNKQPSIIQHLKDRHLKIPLTFAFASLICGFFWEFWNYWALRKWTYTIPYFNWLKIFEMPLLGYLGYLGFGLETYAIIVFARYNYRKLVHKNI